jgi:protein gp37
LGLKAVPCIIRDDLGEEWMIEEHLIRDNLHRRQLDDPGIARASEYLLRIEEKKQEQVRREKISRSRKGEMVENLPPSEKSRDNVASVLGVSGRQLDKIRTVDSVAPEDIKQQWRDGDISTNKAYKLTKEAIQESDNDAIFNRTNENIEWAKWSWNPVTGCKNTCSYCYARDIANRFYKQGFKPTFHKNRLSAPMNTKIKKSEKDISGIHNVFVCSMADLFGDWVDKKWIDAILESVRNAPEWIFIFLTKNPNRLSEFKFPDNAWVGATIDIQDKVKKTENAFKNVKAKVKFISCEPLKEQIVFNNLSLFNWLIIGGQSKSSNEPEFQPQWEWVESLLNQARENNLKVYFKPNLKVQPKEYPE